MHLLISLHKFKYSTTTTTTTTLHKSLKPLPNARAAAVEGDVCYCVISITSHLMDFSQLYSVKFSAQ